MTVTSEPTPLYLSKPSSIELAIQAFDQGDASEHLYQRFLTLARLGNSEAYFYIGCMYEDGTNSLPRDHGRALECYESCATDCGLIEAFLAAAKLHLFGLGTEKNSN